MALKDKISDDLKSAMKTGDKTRRKTLRMLRAALVEKEDREARSGAIDGS